MKIIHGTPAQDLPTDGDKTVDLSADRCYELARDCAEYGDAEGVMLWIEMALAREIPQK